MMTLLLSSHTDKVINVVPTPDKSWTIDPSSVPTMVSAIGKSYMPRLFDFLYCAQDSDRRANSDVRICVAVDAVDAVNAVDASMRLGRIISARRVHLV